MKKRLPLIDRRTGLRRTAIRYPDGMPPQVDGCRWCGDPLWQHLTRRWAASQGMHVWTEPTNAQVAARRAARAAAVSRRPWLAWCGAMSHNSVGTEVFCEVVNPDHAGEDHDDGDGTTWPWEGVT